MVTAAELGRLGEDVAVRHLQHEGCVVLERNWRCREAGVRGELDVIVRDGRFVVFCEVKTRRGDGAGGPLAAVTAAKQRQLRRLAAAYLSDVTLPRRGIRFDVLAVTWGDPPSVDHRRGVC